MPNDNIALEYAGRVTVIPNATIDELWFIAKNKSQDANVVKYAKLWSSSRDLKCVYDKNIMEKLVHFEKQMTTRP